MLVLVITSNKKLVFGEGNAMAIENRRCRPNTDAKSKAARELVLVDGKLYHPDQFIYEEPYTGNGEPTGKIQRTKVIGKPLPPELVNSWLSKFPIYRAFAWTPYHRCIFLA